MHLEHAREENGKKRQKESEKWEQEAYRRKLDEMRAEEKSLHKKTRATKGCTNSSTEAYGESYELCWWKRT